MRIVRIEKTLRSKKFITEAAKTFPNTGAVTIGIPEGVIPMVSNITGFAPK